MVLSIIFHEVLLSQTFERLDGVWGVVHLTFPTHIFSSPVNGGRNQNKINIMLTLIVFHDKICVFIIIFTTLSFLWAIYGLFFKRRKCQLDCMLGLSASIPTNEYT